MRTLAMKILLASCGSLFLGSLLGSCSTAADDCNFRRGLGCATYRNAHPYCDGVFRLPDGSLCTECAKRDSDGVWRFPDGSVWNDQELAILCPDGGLGGASGNGGEAGLGTSGGSDVGGSGLGGQNAGGNGVGGHGNGSGNSGAGASAAGTMGEAGAAGNGDAPCGGPCLAPKAVCDRASNACVECFDKTDCKSAKPACDAVTNRCVECTDKSTCSAAKPACDTATNACVECTDNPDCKDSAKPFCDKATEKCVTCLKQADCIASAASACRAGACVACANDSECSNMPGKGVCNAGTCVQCTAGKEAACAGTSCNPALNQCTATPVGTKDLCEACLADSECMGGNQPDPNTRCVPMKFMSVARPGGFCLRRVAKTCAQPYKIPLDAVSLSGASSETYCGINQDGTRCEAVLDLTANGGKCSDGLDTSCGCVRDNNGNCTQPGQGQGGLCRMVGVDTNRCTYVCGVPDQCPIGLACGGAGYCH